MTSAQKFFQLMKTIFTGVYRSHSKVLSELAQQRDRGESRNYPSRRNRRPQEGHFRQGVEFQQHLQQAAISQKEIVFRFRKDV